MDRREKRREFFLERERAKRRRGTWQVKSWDAANFDGYPYCSIMPRHVRGDYFAGLEER